jgi:Family of unknown function (DUF6029)
LKKILLLLSIFASSQASAQISGELQTSANFYQRDSAVKAYGNPLYDNYLSGAENWLALRYNGEKGFTANVRIDAFQNSNLLNPTNGFTGAGVGMFNVSKEWDNLTITAGHVYDQIGTGIIYRAYEDRALLIDNALFGVQAKYHFSDKLNAKAFTGQVRNLFDRYKPSIKGFNIEADLDYNTAHFTPGFGIVNRTMDDASMNNVVSIINSLSFEDRFVPTYNYNAVTLYNTLNYKAISWYVEGAYKTSEAIKDFKDSLINAPGTVIFTTLGWAIKKIGVNISAKRTENFALRTSPNEPALRGFTNWQPVIAVIRPQRTIARYTPASQDLGETSVAANVVYSPSESLGFNATYTHIDGLQNQKLYRELYLDAEVRTIKNTAVHVGYQFLSYNQEVYQLKGKFFDAHTFFSEITYKLSEKRSLKADLQYMHGKGDYGSWAYALLEYDIAPRWAFAIGDMFNIASTANFSIHPGLKNQHYPNVFVAHTRNAHRFTAQFVKQVEGINCTGGVCRYEPAFSGFKFGIVSSF